MPEDDAERQVREFLEIIGFTVEPIPAILSKRRADYRAVDKANNSYILEVKGKTNDDEYVQELLSKGEAFREEIVGRTNVASRKVRDAAEQLKLTPVGPDVFRLIALVTASDDPETQAVQFSSTLYGTVDLLIPEKDDSPRAIPCFYFSYNEFFELRQVDAALILLPGRSQICLNSFSHRIKEFRRTELFRIHDQHDAVIDPEQMEARKEAFVADCNLDRHNETGILQYVKQKYGLQHPLITFKPKQHTAATVIRRNEP